MQGSTLYPMLGNAVIDHNLQSLADASSAEERISNQIHALSINQKNQRLSLGQIAINGSPFDIIIFIGSFLKYNDCLNLSGTCRTFFNQRFSNFSQLQSLHLPTRQKIRELFIFYRSVKQPHIYKEPSSCYSNDFFIATKALHLHLIIAFEPKLACLLTVILPKLEVITLTLNHKTDFKSLHNLLCAFQLLPSLRKLSLEENKEGCQDYNMSSGQHYGYNILPQSISKLTQLKILKITGLICLRSLPDESISTLTQLRALTLSELPHLNALPESIGNLTELRKLSFFEAGCLDSLSTSISRLTRLRELSLSHRGKSTIPEAMRYFTQLRKLYLSGGTIPEFIGHFIQLQALSLSFIDNTVLPESIGNLVNLKELDLRYSRRLTHLPHSIGKLTQLQILWTEGLHSLIALPESIGGLVNLRKLRLGYMPHLTHLPHSIGKLTQLQMLSTDGLSLIALPDSIGQLISLQEMWLTTAREFSVLPSSIGELRNLEKLYLPQHLSLPEEIRQQLPSNCEIKSCMLYMI